MPISTDINEISRIVLGLTITNQKLEQALEQATEMHNTKVVEYDKLLEENTKLKEEITNLTLGEAGRKLIAGEFKKAD